MRELTEKHPKDSETKNDRGDCQPEVLINFNDAGTKLFSDLTSRNIGRKIGVFLNDTPISILKVIVPITDGKTVISSGNFTIEQADNLIKQLNSGVLPAEISQIN